MAIHLHAFIIETNGASYVHVGRKETCALYILNYRTVDLCWQRTVSNEAFQYRTIYHIVLGISSETSSKMSLSNKKTYFLYC